MAITSPSTSSAIIGGLLSSYRWVECITGHGLAAEDGRRLAEPAGWNKLSRLARRQPFLNPIFQRRGVGRSRLGKPAGAFGVAAELEIARPRAAQACSPNSLLS